MKRRYRILTITQVMDLIRDSYIVEMINTLDAPKYMDTTFLYKGCKFKTFVTMFRHCGSTTYIRHQRVDMPVVDNYAAAC